MDLVQTRRQTRSARRVAKTSPMTIGVGFLCSDGIVLASDTLYTSQNKRHAAKLWSFRAGSVAVGMVGAGDAILIQALRAAIDRGLSADMSPDDVADMSAKAIRQIFENHFDPNDGEFSLWVLIGVRSGGQLVLFENRGSTTVAPIYGSSQCIGCGSSVGDYFADWLFGGGLSAQWARSVAASLIRQSKRYSDGCGGDTHILTIPLEGSPRLTPQDQVAELEQQIAEIEDTMREVLVFGLGVVGVDINQATRDVRRGVLDQIRKVSRAHYAPIPAGKIVRADGSSTDLYAESAICSGPGTDGRGCGACRWCLRSSCPRTGCVSMRFGVSWSVPPRTSPHSQSRTILMTKPHGRCSSSPSSLIGPLSQ